MFSTVDSRGMRFSQQLYERLLALYPRAHREEYGPAMAQLFGDQCRDAWRDARGWGLVGLWLRVLPDLVETSVLEHLATLNERKSMIERIGILLRPRSAPLSVFLGVFVAVFLLVVTTSIIVTFILPESYASTARVLVQWDGSDKQATGGQQVSPSYDPYFIQTEFEVIQSQAVLGRVIEALDLNSVWGKKYAGGAMLKEPESLALLKARLDMRPVRNTSLIEIRVYGEEPNEPARIANTIAETYQEYRRDLQRRLALNAIKVLEERFAEQDKKVKEAQQVVENLRKELNISESDAMGMQPGPLTEADTLRRLQGMLIDGLANYAKGDKLLQELKATPPGELKNVLPTAMQDALLNELLTRLSLVEQQRILLKKDSADEHPSVKTATAQIEDLERKIAMRCNGIIKGLEANVASLKSYLDSIDSEIKKAKEADIAKSEQSRPYYEAKRQLEELVRFRAILHMKLASEKMDADVAKTTTVEIVDRATPGFRPVRPNKPLNIFLGGLCGTILALILGGGAAFITSKLEKRTRAQTATP